MSQRVALLMMDLARRGAPVGRAHADRTERRRRGRSRGSGSLGRRRTCFDPGHAAPILDHAPSLLDPLRQQLGQHPRPAHGVVDPAVVPVAEDHAGVDHRRHRGANRRPAEALDVDEAAGLFVVDPFVAQVARVGRQEAGQRQTGQRVLGELAQKVPGLLERLELQRVERIEHAPALVVKPL